MTATYDLISEQVLTSAASSVSFTSIPQGFKDLQIEVVARFTRAIAQDSMGMYFGSAPASQYSYTAMWGNGSVSGSFRASNAPDMFAGNITGESAASGVFGFCAIDILNYTNTSTNKSVLVRYSNASEVGSVVNLSRSTSAISELTLRYFGGSSFNFVSGSTFRLFGIVG